LAFVAICFAKRGCGLSFVPVDGCGVCRVVVRGNLEKEPLLSFVWGSVSLCSLSLHLCLVGHKTLSHE
jgi:hypothetical protein